MPVAFSVPRGNRSEISGNKSSIGPGQYNPAQHHENSPPKFKIGTEVRGKTKHQNTPGPGNYDPTEVKEAPSYSLSKKITTIPNSIHYNPGPGTYQQDYNEQRKSPSYSLRARTSHTPYQASPGPAAYNQAQDSVKEHTPAYTLRGGDGKRGFKDVRNFPGPGTYVTEKDAGFQKKSHVFGSEKQRVEHKSTAKVNPGPGAYDGGSWFNNEGSRYSKTMGTKLIDNTLNEAKNTPSPGAYDPSPRMTKKKEPSFSMPRQKRGQKNLDAGPPPDAYNIRSNINYSPYWSFGGELRKPLGDHKACPGPGTYESKSNMGGTANYSMRLKCPLDDKEGRSKPGPGAYAPNIEMAKTAAPKVFIGTGKRKPLAAKNPNPGPGQYNESSTLKKKGAKFYSDTRINKYNKEVPGPGNYENLTDFQENLNKKKGPSMGQKYEGLKQDKIVGPGAYHPTVNSSKKNASEIRFGSEERGRSKLEGVPGPGTYDSKNINEVPFWGFGSNPRSTIQLKKGVPGPGTYESGQNGVRTSVPKYGFGLRPEIMDKRVVPGPGNYDPVQSQTKEKIAAYKIGTGKRQLISVNAKGVPGPGNYDPKSELGKRAAGIGYGQKSGFDLGVGPGPGTYEIDRAINPLPAYAR